MRVFIAGITGYVGTALQLALKADGHKVYGCGRPSPNGAVDVKEYSVHERQIGDTSLNDLGDLFRELEITHVINLAASLRKDDTSPALHELLKANVEFAANIAQAATANDFIRFIQASTYSTSVDGETYTPQTFYAATKKAAEDLTIYFSYARGLDLVILNFYDIYGPSQPHVRLINALGNALIDSIDIELSEGVQEFCPLFVDDAVAAIIHALKVEGVSTTSFEHWSVFGPEVMLVRDVPDRIATSLGLAWRPNQVTFSKPMREREIIKFSPLREALPGWQATTKFDVGIRETFGGVNEAS
jgi:UDP-glucuronate 4-epimerase